MKDPKDPGTMPLALEPEKRPVGRPAVHKDTAARMRAYRARLKAAGVKTVRRQVRVADPTEPLESDLIDLSAVSPWKR